MPPYEMLYRRRFRTPIYWGEVGQCEIRSAELVQETNQKIEMIWARLKAAQDRQKSYTNQRRPPIEFQDCDMVMLNVSPLKVAYRLELPEELVEIHNIIHVSSLRKCLVDDSVWVSLDEITLNNKLDYVEEPVSIIDKKVKEIRNKRIRTYKLIDTSEQGNVTSNTTSTSSKCVTPESVQAMILLPSLSYLLSVFGADSSGSGVTLIQSLN
ncbi:uncharacterized protein [Rutidosis leptorrhynchoides]|uniref:uncharacterized protein n=1 Tax=Rutidosis leptorrhynchoides TaxID=125765 RepID=UPI003A99AA9C